MHLANNQLSGTIPETFWTSDVFFKELMSLNLAANRFEGTLPLYINGLITQVPRRPGAGRLGALRRPARRT